MILLHGELFGGQLGESVLALQSFQLSLSVACFYEDCNRYLAQRCLKSRVCLELRSLTGTPFNDLLLIRTGNNPS